MIIRRSQFIRGLLFSSLAYSLKAQSRLNPQGTGPAREFVQKFYNWYTPIAREESPTPPWITAIRKQDSAFSRELATALQLDADAQSVAKGEIVGIDFDPFLSGQDPCDHYATESVNVSGEKYLAEIHCVMAGKEREKPVVISELRNNGGHWIFVNFHYAGNKDLLSLLDKLRQSREHPASR
jgi:hypothetical protein